MKTRLVKTLSLLLVTALLGPLAAAGAPPEPPEIVVISSNPEITFLPAQTSIDLAAALPAPGGRVGLIIELQAPPLGLATLPQATQFDVESAASRAYLAEVEQQQEMALAEMVALAPSLEIDFRYRAAFNGFSVRLDPAEAQTLLQLDTIKHIYPDRLQTLMLDASLDVINAPAFWADLGGQGQAGEGIRIAVIDTGIRSEHPMFSGEGFTPPPGFPRGYCVDHPDDPDFQCNGKLIATRYYTPTFEIHGAESYSPLDVHGHGSHVAGIIAGNPVEVPAGAIVPEPTAISGVAPQAYLLVYKAFFTKPDGNAFGTDGMLLAALEDALLDGAEVVNNSWGNVAIEDPQDNPYATAVRALNAAGAVVVFAAGNSGPGAGTISCPGCLEEVITVGSSSADRIFANTLDVTGPGEIPENLLGLAALSGSGPALTADLAAVMLDAQTAEPLNADACDIFSGEVFSNTLALIPRGGCPFLDKVTHAQQAGALAAVIFNNEPGFPIRMTNLESTQIPAVFLSQDQGEALRDWVTGSLSPTVRLNALVTAVHNVNWQDILWKSSSVGPNPDPDVLKPDIVAPGINILSAMSPVFTGGTNYAIWHGTSTAAAHVSGAAALLLQQHPGWKPQQIKTALTSTADQLVYQPDGTTLATPFMAGSGRLDLDRARHASLTFSDPSFANSNCSNQCGWADIQVENVSISPAWREAVVYAPTGMQVTIEPDSFLLPLGGSREFSISVDVSTLPPDQWYFASVTWKDKFGTFPSAYLPIAIYVTDSIQVRFTKTADRLFASPGDTVNYTLRLVNEAPLAAPFSLTDPIPENASYLPGSATGGLTYDAIADQLQAAVNLAPAQMQLVPDVLHGTYYSLPELGVGPVNCPDTSCDESELLISGLDFYFNGQPATDLVWSTNGYLQVGPVRSGLSNPNQNLPDSASPNNLLAPLWADLIDGTWYYALVQVGEEPNEIVYYVFEWKEAALKNEPSRKYSFQVWIERGTDEIWFVYGPQTAALTTGTVGIENVYGSVGATVFFNGSGTAPVSGSTLKAGSQLAEAVFTYALEIGPAKNVNVINHALVENELSNQTLQASATVFVGDRVYLPVVFR